MNSRELLKAIGEIDDRFIDEAAEVYSAAKPAARRARRRGWITAAACLIVAVGVGVTVLPATLLAGSKSSSESKAYSQNTSGNYASDSSVGGSVRNSDAVQENVQAIQDLVFPEQNYLIPAGPASAEESRHQEKAGFEQALPESTIKRDAARALWQQTVNGR